MSIIHSYHKYSKPKISVEDVYEKSDVTFDSVIITFSHRIITALKEDDLIELIDEDRIKSISCPYPVYRFKGTNIGLFKTTVGAPIASGLMEEVCYVYSCSKVVLFGSCGALDKSLAAKSLVIPTAAYRDEGVSYHYLEPNDYIDIANHQKVREIFQELNVNYAVGKTWTTDAFYRETEEEIALRKKEGCIVVEMEIAACQAVALTAGIEFFAFLYTADNLDASSWDEGLRDHMLSKDARLQILSIAFEVAKRI